MSASDDRAQGLLAALWSSVRALSERREVDLDLRLLGRPADLDAAAGDLLLQTLEHGVSSALNSERLEHVGLELSYSDDRLSVRLEHDGTIPPAFREAAERAILSRYSAIGSAGGTLALSSGRGFGLRLEISFPYAHSAMRTEGPTRASRADLRSPGQNPLYQMERLTPQEETTLSLLASGLSNKEIASRMSLGVGTVKFHLAQIYQKLGVQGKGRLAAVARARELGLLFD